MKYLIALLIPPLGMALVGRVGLAIVCLLLMITVIGWPIAAVWALIVVNNAENEKKFRRILEHEKRRDR